MKKTIKKIIEAILIIIACVALVLMTGQAEKESTQLLWSLGWMAVLAIDCKILDRMGAFDNQ